MLRKIYTYIYTKTQLNHLLNQMKSHVLTFDLYTKKHQSNETKSPNNDIQVFYILVISRFCFIMVFSVYSTPFGHEVKTLIDIYSLTTCISIQSHLTVYEHVNKISLKFQLLVVSISIKTKEYVYALTWTIIYKVKESLTVSFSALQKLSDWQNGRTIIIV